MQFVNHRPPTVDAVYDESKLIMGREMRRRDIRIYHFPYCFYNQVQLKTCLYGELPNHGNIRAWFYNFFVPWDESNRVELEEKWGAWGPDPTTYTQKFNNVIPKAVKPIFKDIGGIKWEK